MPSHSSSNPTRLERVSGALLGVHAGDALGATLEFESWEKIRTFYPNGLREIVGGGPFGWPAGAATDDTDLTRAVLLAYREVKRGSKHHVSVLAANNMLNWLDGKDWPGRKSGVPPADVGNATKTGLTKYRSTGDVSNAGSGVGSAGNGSLSRCIPTGLFQRDLDMLIGESILISRVTHEDPRCTVACAAYNAIVRELVAGIPAKSAFQAGRQTAKKLGNKDVVDCFDAAERLDLAQTANQGPNELLPLKAAGYVLESLTIALAAMLDERNFEEIIVDVARIGKDTDTNASIAGGLIGARDGVKTIPQRWRAKLQYGSEFEHIAKKLTPSTH